MYSLFEKLCHKYYQRKLKKSNCVIWLRVVHNFEGFLNGLFHPAFLARVISWLAFVCRHFHGITEKPDPGPVGPDPNGSDPGRIPIHFHASR